MPTALDGLAAYSAVVLADVPAVALGTARMQTLQSFVRDLGRGLVVSGGQNSYGVGEYAGTPLEQTLPVSMDVPQHKETPDIAVILIIESLESNISVNISKEAAKGVVSLLNPRDQVGISAAYGTLTIPMQHVTNKSAINKAIDAMDPADPNSYRPDLQNAEQVLLHTTAKIKHVILLGDGDAFDTGYQAQVVKMASENITVSTVETNSANLQEMDTMVNIASWGKGRFYRADDPGVIPQVLLKETEQASRRTIINDSFTPIIVGNHPLLTGLDERTHAGWIRCDDAKAYGPDGADKPSRRSRAGGVAIWAGASGSLDQRCTWVMDLALALMERSSPLVGQSGHLVAAIAG